MALKHRGHPKIYVSYRRQDEAGTAGRLFDRLSQSFESQNIFIDVDAIAPGVDFAAAIKQEVQFADVFLVLIGAMWTRASDDHGRPRIQNPEDFVRLEIEAAIASQKPIIPVLVGGARVPLQVDLPASLRSLTQYNAAELRHATFRRDVDQLVTGIKQIVGKRSSELAISPNRQTSVFVSHATVDRDWVETEIVDFLSGNNLKPWYSDRAISTSTQWEREILKGLQVCEWFSLVVSPAAAKSDWVKDELFWAMENRPTRIVPIIMKKSDLYQFHIRLPRIQNIDFTVDRTAACQKLLAAFADGPQDRE
jgi:hypothetical protein